MKTLGGRASLLDRTLFSATEKQPIATIAHRTKKPIQQRSTASKPRGSLFQLRAGAAFATSIVPAGPTWEGVQVLAAAEADGCSGLYIVVHLPTGKRYTGCSKNIGQRYRQHASALRSLLHHCRPLQQLWLSSTTEEWAFVIVSEGRANIDDESRAIFQAGDLALNQPTGSLVHVKYPTLAVSLGMLPSAWF